MDETWHQAFLERAHTRDYWDRVREAEDVIREAFDRHLRPYVAFSGGKDSTVMAHMVLQHRPSTTVLHWDYGAAYVPDPIHEEILGIARHMGARLRLETSPLYEQQGRQAVGVLGKHMIGWLLPKLARRATMRASSACGRPNQASVAGASIRAGACPTSECWPMASWSWLDVWAYIVSHGLPYLSVYDQTALSLVTTRCDSAPSSTRVHPHGGCAGWSAALAMAQPPIVVVVPSYGRPDSLSRLLQSLRLHAPAAILVAVVQDGHEPDCQPDVLLRAEPDILGLAEGWGRRHCRMRRDTCTSTTTTRRSLA